MGCYTKVAVVSCVMMHLNYRILKHAKIFQFQLSDRRAVIGNKDQFGLAPSNALFCGPVTEGCFSALKDKGEFLVNSL